MLIRHAAAATAGGVVAGHRGCEGLSAAGRRQAERLRDRLAATGELADASVFISSIIARAVQTAEIIATAVGDGSLELRRECRVCEIHWGEADGMPWTEFDRRFGPALPHVPVAPGGESPATFLIRARSALRHVADEGRGRTTVIVTHSGVVEASLAEFAKLYKCAGRLELRAENAGITVWSRDDAGAAWCLDGYNDVAHLRG